MGRVYQRGFSQPQAGSVPGGDDRHPGGCARVADAARGPPGEEKSTSGRRCLPGLMESVDGWPMAIPMSHAIGGPPKPVPVLRDVTGGWEPPPERSMSQPARGPSWALDMAWGGPSLRELRRGNWMVSGLPGRHVPGGVSGWGGASCGVPRPTCERFRPLPARGSGDRGPTGDGSRSR